MESLAKMIGIQCDSEDQEYDIEDVCEAGDDVWSVESCDDKATEYKVGTSKNENAKVFHGSEDRRSDSHG